MNNTFTALQRIAGNDERVAKVLAQIAEAFDVCQNKQAEGEDPLTGLWRDYLHNVLTSLGTVLDGIGVERITAYPTNLLQTLWLTTIQKAEKNIWTTNVKNPRAAFGRVSDKNLLELQKEAITNGVTITRVFVYEKPPLSGVEETVNDHGSKTVRELDRTSLQLELFKLRDVISDQLHAGITVCAIEADKFRRTKGYTGALGTDFMIVDDRYVYTTSVPDKLEEPATSSFLTPAEYIEDAKKAREEIHKRAILIENNSDIGQLFNP